MDKKNDVLIKLINDAIKEVVNYMSGSGNHSYESQQDTLLILLLMKNDLQKQNDIRKRLLRGFKDISTMTSINFEEASYYNSIFKIYSFLTENEKEFKDLELLRLDYGKEFPI